MIHHQLHHHNQTMKLKVHIIVYNFSHSQFWTKNTKRDCVSSVINTRGRSHPLSGLKVTVNRFIHLSHRMTHRHQFLSKYEEQGQSAQNELEEKIRNMELEKKTDIDVSPLSSSYEVTDVIASRYRPSTAL